MTGRVALVGLDAAEWWVVESLIEQGHMPNVDKLLATSDVARLQADRPFKAEGRWTEILTGRSADESQYWSIVGFDPVTYRVWYDRSCHGSYFFARPDLRSVIFDVPNSVIAEEVHGTQITGWGSHAAQFPSASQPASVLATIDQKFGVHRAMLSDGHHGWHNETYLDNLQAAMVDGIRQRVEIARWLDEQQPDWQLFFTVFGETHVAGHQYIHGILPDHPLHGLPAAALAGERLRRIFAAVDDAVGTMVATLGDDTTYVLFAAHGMEANAADVLGGVLVPEFLHRRTFGEPLLEFPDWSPGDDFLLLDPKVLPRHFLERCLVRPAPTTSSGRRRYEQRIVRRMRHHLPASVLGRFEATYWRRPDWWEMNVRRPATRESRDVFSEAARIELDSVISASWYRPYWPQMRTFVLPSFSDCHIRVNLRGRESEGIVDPDDYDDECRRIESELRELTDPRSGEPVVDDVIRMRPDDPMAEVAPGPDLVVTFSRVTDAIRHPTVGVIGPAPLMRMGEHTPNGWAAITNGAGKRRDLGTFRPRDLSASVVELLGLPASPNITGTPFSQPRENP